MTQAKTNRKTRKTPAAFCVRLSPEQVTTLAETAARCGMTKTDVFLRGLALASQLEGSQERGGAEPAAST